MVVARFEAELTEEMLSYEDLNSDAGREEVRMIELPRAPDMLAIRKFLCGSKA